MGPGKKRNAYRKALQTDVLLRHRPTEWTPRPINVWVDSDIMFAITDYSLSVVLNAPTFSYYINTTSSSGTTSTGMFSQEGWIFHQSLHHWHTSLCSSKHVFPVNSEFTAWLWKVPAIHITASQVNIQIKIVYLRLSYVENRLHIHILSKFIRLPPVYTSFADKIYHAFRYCTILNLRGHTS